MKHILSTSEIVLDLDREVEPKELCATGEAEFDETRRTLSVKLDSFVRQVRHAAADTCLKPSWLPRPQTVREQTDEAEASDVARDIFTRWASKVREAATGNHDRPGARAA